MLVYLNDCKLPSFFFQCHFVICKYCFTCTVWKVFCVYAQYTFPMYQMKVVCLCAQYTFLMYRLKVFCLCAQFTFLMYRPESVLFLCTLHIYNTQQCDISSSIRHFRSVPIGFMLFALLSCDFTVVRTVPVPVETCNRMFVSLRI